MFGTRQRAGLDDDDLNMKHLRDLDAMKLLADRLLKPRLPFDPAQFSAIIDIAVENRDLMSQQGGLHWTHVVPRTLLVRQAEHLLDSGQGAAPLAPALERLRDAFKSRDPALRQRAPRLLARKTDRGRA